MSSNMIKAYSIAYDTQKIKSLDMELRENALEERVLKIVAAKQGGSVFQEAGTFIPGLFAENLGEIEPVIEAPKTEPAVIEPDIDAIKNSLREEIMAEMMPIMNRKGEDIVANAKAQANGLIEAAKREAESIKESTLKAASAQGYEEGLKHAKIEEERKLFMLETKQRELEQEYAKKFAELEPAFVRVLTELVKKLTSVAYDTHNEVLCYLMETGLGFAQKDTYFDVILSTEDYKKYSSLFPEIKELYKEKYTLEFKKSADLPNGSCKLENENRVIDCGLGVRLDGLLEELALLD